MKRFSSESRCGGSDGAGEASGVHSEAAGGFIGPVPVCDGAVH